MTELLVFVILLLLSGGCSKFRVDEPSVDAAFFTRGEDGLNPATDKLTGNCFGRAEFDACIYLKNPVAQEKAAVAADQVEQKRRFGVKIRGLNATGFLENARLQVLTLHSPRFTLHSRAHLKTMGHPESAIQFSAYYWSNRMFDYFGARLGPERLPLQGLKIYADDAFTGYSSSNRSIHLALKDGELPRAFSGEVVIHLAAQALADALSGNRLFIRDSTQHNFCVYDPKACCSTEMGCSQALGNGFGDYAAAMMFPDSARLGESIGGTTEGQKICSIHRDLVSLSSYTKNQVFKACDPAGRAVLMGAWYAALWWKVRHQLEAREAGAAVDVDKIFFDHARAWTSTSTFVQAKAAALAASQAFKAGKYSQTLSAAFDAAGI